MDNLGIRGIRTVAVPVDDQQRAIDFYTTTLGFQVTMDAQFGAGNRWVEVSPPGGGTSIALPPRGRVTPGVDTGIRMQTTDATRDHAILRAAGVDVGDLLDVAGAPPMFFVRDPDGNTLVIVEGR